MRERGGPCGPPRTEERGGSAGECGKCRRSWTTPLPGDETRAGRIRLTWADVAPERDDGPVRERRYLRVTSVRAGKAGQEKHVPAKRKRSAGQGGKTPSGKRKRRSGRGARHGNARRSSQDRAERRTLLAVRSCPEDKEKNAPSCRGRLIMRKESPCPVMKTSSRKNA